MRLRTEAWEAERLAGGATRSTGAGNRDRSEAPDPLRTAFQRDRDRILHSPSFRRLKHKTQVFISPDGDHFRTRLTHTLEAAQIARTIARSLALNEDLAEAICLGHDLGHTPFGHLGETVLSEMLGRPFHHAAHSVRIVEVLEAKPHGLNLTLEVRDGIVNSSWNQPQPCTHEAWVVRFADRIAYLNHDVDDAIASGLLDPAEIPAEVGAVLGTTSSERITTLVTDLVVSSDVSRPFGDCRGLAMSDAVFGVMDRLRDFMFERVYLCAELRRETERAAALLRTLMQWYLAEPERLPESAGVEGDPHTQRVADFIAGMTDRFAVATYESIFVPHAPTGFGGAVPR
ncbi:MAG: deoxyguanosinetriphosphate triphosphohydrolase [Acidimicrobiia bacterium]|nr:deoxyguanosinetriphosphate triphosphohydrolase [Acidimicrobiia bacterium]